MRKVIPLHSLVITVGGPPDDGSFDPAEVTGLSQLGVELCAGTPRRDLRDGILTELRRRLTTQLDFGRRVVVDGTDLYRDERMSLASLAVSRGAPVFYYIPNVKTTGIPRAIARGDGIADVIDLRRQTIDPVPMSQTEEDLRSRFAGITVVGDIHGMLQPMLAAIEWARSRRHWIILLGDVLDYGPDSLETVEEAYRIVMRGEGELLMGNHERKIARWLTKKSSENTLSDGNRITAQALASLSPAARQRWEGRFRALFSQAVIDRDIAGFSFAHAAVHPGRWAGNASMKEIETYALFGEFEPETTPGIRPPRGYTWTNAVPAGRIAVVGHDIRSTESPLTVDSADGGKAIFLDTGSGKGGRLSSLDLGFTEQGVEVIGFNSH